MARKLGRSIYKTAGFVGCLQWLVSNEVKGRSTREVVTGSGHPMLIDVHLK